LPVFGLALVAGHLADRYDRRHLVVACLGLEIVCLMGLVLVSTVGVADLWPFLAIALVFGTARAFMAPPARALLPNLVPAPHLPNAFAWESIAWQAATVGGPAAGGFLYAVDAVVAYGTAIAFAAAAALLMALIRRRPMEGRVGQLTWQSVIAGVAMIRRTPVLLGAISLDLFAVLFGGVTALLPIFTRDILLLGEQELGLLRAAPGVGAAFTALLLAQWPVPRRVGATLFLSVGLFGAATVVFGLSTNFHLSLAALFTIGAVDMVSVFIRITLVPLVTPDNLRGRVLAVEQIFISASNELGTFESGMAAAIIGPVGAAVLGGVVTLLVVAVWLRWFPQLRRVDRFEELRPA
jgi:MFS family permease